VDDLSTLSPLTKIELADDPAAFVVIACALNVERFVFGRRGSSSDLAVTARM